MKNHGFSIAKEFSFSFDEPSGFVGVERSIPGHLNLSLLRDLCLFQPLYVLYERTGVSRQGTELEDVHCRVRPFPLFLFAVLVFSPRSYLWRAPFCHASSSRMARVVRSFFLFLFFSPLLLWRLCFAIASFGILGAFSSTPARTAVE